MSEVSKHTLPAGFGHFHLGFWIYLGFGAWNLVLSMLFLKSLPPCGRINSNGIYG
jgi:hypothetical protein